MDQLSHRGLALPVHVRDRPGPPANKKFVDGVALEDHDLFEAVRQNSRGDQACDAATDDYSSMPETAQGDRVFSTTKC